MTLHAKPNLNRLSYSVVELKNQFQTSVNFQNKILILGFTDDTF